MQITIADRLASSNNRPAGFDWMRITLAASIVVWHSVVTSYGSAFQDKLWVNPIAHPILVLLLGMFFALSGFLVAGSLERCRTMVSFAGLRVMRIFPALVVETLLSAFVLGPLLTQVDWSTYFSAPEFRDYLLNMLGVVHFVLPGLFMHNPLPDIVNGQLWTVPFELRCYEVLIGISLLGIYSRRWLLVATIVLFTVLKAGKSFYTDSYMEMLLSLSGNQLVLCFLVGVALFRFRSTFPWSGWGAAVCAVIVWILSMIPGGTDFMPAPIAYLTVYLGLLNPPRVSLLFSGDYSYGLFLYGFPVQQAVASSGAWAHHWYVSVAVALPLTALIAVASWWLIEKPVLSRKGKLIWLEDKVIAGMAAGRAWRARRAAGPGAPFDPTSVGPAKNRGS